ncbi:Ni/Fe hydrogenase subunit alpha [Thermodesulfobacteriota bacterium]
MSRKIDINVHHITRIEGHGNIVLKAGDGTIEKLEWQVPEAPRFFEVMVRGRMWSAIQVIVSRICGICSVTHSLAAVKAVEDAMGVPVSEQTNKLRMLAHYGEQLQSHILHVGYLIVPDLLGAKSVLPLASSHPDAVKTVIALHRTANQWIELIGGRATHPVTFRIGGFEKLPTENDLKDLRKSLEDSIPKLQAVADLVLSLAGNLPDFERETEYIALVEPGRYPFYHGHIGSTDISQIEDIHEFESVVNEYVSPQSTAKWTRWHRDSYAVGALARFNLNADHLLPLAAKTADAFGLKKGCHNPYMNTVAQVIESVQVVERALQFIDELLSSGIKPEKPQVVPRAGVGVGVVEAPRGILFHRYAFDDDGRCMSANLCIPTNQNHANIQKDLEVLVPQIMDKDQEEIRQMLEMLVRAYDPCVSCSTH